MKKLLSAILTLSMLSAPVLCAGAADDISVTLDGKEIAFDKAPRIINGRVMVPMRKAFEAIDAKISWDGEKSAATAIKEAQYAKFTNGADTMELGVCKDGNDDGELLYYADRPLDSEAVIIDGTMYVPMRVLAQIFHYNVEWNADKSRAEITSPEETDDVIYYSSWTDGGHMYRADANGQHRQILSTDDCYATNYNSFGYGNGYIFYSVRDIEHRDSPDKVEGQLYRIKTDGTGKEKLTENSVELLSDRKKAYLCPTADENGDLFFLMSSSTNGARYGYDNQSYIYKVNTESGEITQILDAPVETFYIYVYEDYIFFKYDSDEIDKRYSIYRMDKDGENIINVTGNVAAGYVDFDTENDRLIFSNYSSGVSRQYNTALDGSDVQIIETDNRTRNSYGLSTIRYEGDGFAVGIKNYDSYITNEYSVVDNEGNELSVIKAPEGYELDYKVTAIGNKIYYGISREPDISEFKTIYVTSLDELLGMEYISVGSEKVDGKYVIKRRLSEEDFMDILKSWNFDAQIHSVNIDGTDDECVLKDYFMSSFFDYEENDGKILLTKPEEVAETYSNRSYYLFDPTSGSIEKHTQKGQGASIRPNDIFNEETHYGITIKSDGTLENFRDNY